MDLGNNVVIHQDRWEDYEIDERRQGRIDEVQEYLEKGLLTRDKIHERFTGFISRREDSSAVAAITKKFHELSNRSLSGVTKETFTSYLQASIGITEDSITTLDLLFDMMCWYAAFPFPLAHEESQQQHVIDKSGFLRAISFLLHDELPSHHTKISYDQVTGRLGPHDGWIVVSRHAGEGGVDWRRQLFRSLAKPTMSTAENRHIHTISVPRFLVLEELGSPEGSPESSDADHDWQTTVWTHDEDERTVDLRDVLAHTSPVKYRISGRPMRESYDDFIASGHVPIHLQTLGQLGVDRRSLGELVALLGAQTEDIEDSEGEGREITPFVAWGQQLEGKGDEYGDLLDWEAFDTMVEQNETQFLNALGRFFSKFVADPGQ